MQELIDALCIINAGYRTEDEKEMYQKAIELVHRTADYLHLLNQKEKLDDKISTYNQNNNDKCGCFVSDGTTSMNCKFCGKHYSQHI